MFTRTSCWTLRWAAVLLELWDTLTKTPTTTTAKRMKMVEETTSSIRV